MIWEMLSTNSLAQLSFTVQHVPWAGSSNIFLFFSWEGVLHENEQPYYFSDNSFGFPLTSEIQERTKGALKKDVCVSDVFQKCRQQPLTPNSAHLSSWKVHIPGKPILVFTCLR